MYSYVEYNQSPSLTNIIIAFESIDVIEDISWATYKDSKIMDVSFIIPSFTLPLKTIFCYLYLLPEVAKILTDPTKMKLLELVLTQKHKVVVF